MCNRILYVTVQNAHYQAKYKSQIESWVSLDYNAEYFNLQRSLSSLREFYSVVKKYDIIYFRNDYLLNRMWFFLIFALSGKKLILEIPTPISVFWHEVNLSPISKWKKSILPTLIKFYLKLIVKRVDLIIEMAEEKDPIVLSQKDKIFIWQNGINSIDLYKIPNQYLEKQKNTLANFLVNKEIRFIMVANLAEYHGLDRFINGLREYYANNGEYKIILDIISGDNDVLNANKKLVEQYGLSNHVNFIGYVQINDLWQHYQKANFSIGLLGSFRKNLEQGSALKLREYALFGLPSIIDIYDYDLSETDYVQTCASSKSPIDITSVILFYNQLIVKYGDNLTNAIQEYAINNLTWQHKVEKLRDECVARTILIHNI